ncbi:MAG: arsenite efflux transporter metallochaperone ArsD [Acidobacteria bacterium]|nr:arsenite efflux transporter metallochaperone ArsD [Acidobacteriota bacterium]
MPLLQVFDPPMCCSTGVCGPVVDPELTRFAADLEWAAGQGVIVERFNLAQQPEAFVGNAKVRSLLEQEGDACLPILLVGDEVVSRGVYPSRADLARVVGVPEEEGRPQSRRLTLTPTGGGCAPGSGCC